MTGWSSSSCGEVGEARSGERRFRVACVGYSVCAVFISSSLVSSDGAWAMGVVDLDSRAERMANSDCLTMRIWIHWKNDAPSLVSGSGAAFNYGIHA